MSDEYDQPAPPRRGRPRMSVRPRTIETTASVDEIIQRRISGDPRYTRPPDLPLRDREKWYVKEANSYGDPNRHFSIVHEEGYLPVTVEDLPDGVSVESLGYRVAEDGRTLCRGERGQERLYKMTREHRALIEARKTDLNRKGMGSERALREDLANAVGAQHGDEAGSFVHRHVRITGEDREGPIGG